MFSDCLFEIGDLVEYKSWFEGDAGWLSLNGMIGIVIDIIEINQNSSGFVFSSDQRIYDVKVYWYAEGESEVIPDLLLDHYTPKPGIEL